jgi:hypothetical protein
LAFDFPYEDGKDTTSVVLPDQVEAFASEEASLLPEEILDLLRQPVVEIVGHCELSLS